MKSLKRSSHRQQKDDQSAECRACGPPYIFKHQSTESLFLEYSFHIRRVAISSLLGIYILLTAVLAILYFVYQRAPTEKNIYHVSLCVVGICLYIYMNTKYLKTKTRLKVVSYLLWVLLLLFAFISLPLGRWTTSEAFANKELVYPAEGIWQLIFIIYCMYLVLPVNFFMTLVFGIVLSLVHTAVILIRLQDMTLMKEHWSQVRIYSLGNLTLKYLITRILQSLMLALCKGQTGVWGRIYHQLCFWTRLTWCCYLRALIAILPQSDRPIQMLFLVMGIVIVISLFFVALNYVTQLSIHSHTMAESVCNEVKVYLYTTTLTIAFYRVNVWETLLTLLDHISVQIVVKLSSVKSVWA